MRKLARSHTAQIGFGLVALYWIATAFVPGRYLIAAMNGAFGGVLVTVVIVYFPLFFQSIRNGKLDRVSILAIGMGCIWLALVVNRGWSTLSHIWVEYFPRYEERVVGFVGFLGVLGGIMHVVAPNTDKTGAFRGPYRTLLFFASIFGVAVALILTALQAKPD